MYGRLPRLIRFGTLALLCVSAGLIAFAAEEDEGADGDRVPLTVPKAVCSPEDSPETGLQGQVPAALRAAGFQGFNCNLKLIGQSRNDGGNWQSAEFKERRKTDAKDSDQADGEPLHTCGYYGSQSPRLSPKTRDPASYGVPVIDLTDPRNPTRTGFLQTTSMLDPWESLRVNERRQLLVADNGRDGAFRTVTDGGPEVDVYDLSQDCRAPQLLASAAIGTGTDGGTLAPATPKGHEGAFAPDGLTYYIGDVFNRTYHAVDLTDPTKPKHIASFDMKTLTHERPDVAGNLSLGAHGLSVSDDGNRLYVTSGAAGTPLADLGNPDAPGSNGFVILDTSEVQARLSNPQIKVVSRFLFKDGSAAQHTIPVHIRGRPYVIHVDEGGSNGLSYAAWAATCAAGFTPFPMARIVDIGDETKPKLASKLILEMNDPAKCANVLPDLVGLSVFTYGTHYCSVDNRHNATTLACGMFNSGIRIFDIRDPRRPKEIAYFNPAGVTTPSPGSNHQTVTGFKPGQPDWCSAQVHLDAEHGTVWTTCQDNGLLMLRFEHGVWPFEDSTTPPGEQN
jgi:hypothetical protein